MEYQVIGYSKAHNSATFEVKQNHIPFGITVDSNELPNPAELLLGAFAACCLKNIERFSRLLRFDYDEAQVTVMAHRQEAPPKLIHISYDLRINSQDNRLNVQLLHTNIKKYGTIYNTLKETCSIKGNIVLI